MPTTLWVELTYPYCTQNSWPSEYLLMHMCSAINDLSCYIVIICKSGIREPEHAILANLLCPQTCPSLSPGACSNSCPLNQWCYLTIWSSVTSFSFCFQSFPASRFIPVSQLFTWGGQSIGASTSVLLMNIQGWFPLGLSGLILQSKRLSRVFSSTTVRKQQFFSSQPYLWSISHIHTQLLEKP